jgi:hypothetical protein
VQFQTLQVPLTFPGREGTGIIREATRFRELGRIVYELEAGTVHLDGRSLAERSSLQLYEPSRSSGQLSWLVMVCGSWSQRRRWSPTSARSSSVQDEVSVSVESFADDGRRKKSYVGIRGGAWALQWYEARNSLTLSGGKPDLGEQVSQSSQSAQCPGFHGAERNAVPGGDFRLAPSVEVRGDDDVAFVGA